MTVTIFFVRHGQSEDNVRSIWAGWKDAPLSEKGREVRSASGGAGYLLTNGFHSTIRHGSIFPDLLPYVKQQQAEAVGKGFASQNISAIFASDLKRAHATGRAIHEYQPEERKPPFTVVEGLREQHFGEAEGKPWVHLQPGDSDYDPEAKVYTVPLGRSEKFPDGESLDDLRQRTVKSVLEPHLLPLIWKSRGLPEAEGGAIVCASHGLCISELGAAIVARDPDIPKGTYHFAGLVNTAWHCVRVGIKGEKLGAIPPADEPVDLNARLTVDVLKMNDHSHLRPKAASADTQPQEENKLREYLSGKAA